MNQSVRKAARHSWSDVHAVFNIYFVSLGICCVRQSVVPNYLSVSGAYLVCESIRVRVYMYTDYLYSAIVLVFYSLIDWPAADSHRRLALRDVDDVYSGADKPR